MASAAETTNFWLADYCPNVRLVNYVLNEFEPGLTCKFSECHTHPGLLDRYEAVKAIRQLHEAVDRKAEGKLHPKYTQQSYEKYVVGYEKAWDRWCEKEKMVIKKAFNSIDLFGRKRRKA